MLRYARHFDTGKILLTDSTYGWIEDDLATPSASGHRDHDWIDVGLIYRTIKFVRELNI